MSDRSPPDAGEPGPTPTRAPDDRSPATATNEATVHPRPAAGLGNSAACPSCGALIDAHPLDDDARAEISAYIAAAVQLALEEGIEASAVERVAGVVSELFSDCVELGSFEAAGAWALMYELVAKRLT